MTSSFVLPAWEEARSIRHDITPSPVLSAKPPPRPSYHDQTDSRAFQSVTMNSTSKIHSENLHPEYNSLSAERDEIMRKDMQLLECSRLFGSFSVVLGNLDNVIVGINDAFESEGGIEVKVRWGVVSNLLM